MLKFQITNSKSQTNPNDQNPLTLTLSPKGRGNTTSPSPPKGEREGPALSEVEGVRGNLKIGIWVLFGIWCLGFGILISGCGRKETREFKRTSGPIPVRVMRVELKEIVETIDYVGNIKAQAEALVYPKVSGKIIEKVKEDGSSVEKGEAIAYIDRDEVGLKFEKAPVESPLSGVVGRVYVDVGTHVTPQTQIALVVNMDVVKISFDVPENYLPAVSAGQEARITVDAYPEEEFTGRVSKISPVVELDTRAAPVEIIVENQAHKLKSGMFAKVRLAIERRKDAPVMFKEAIIGRGPDTYVYTVEQNTASLKKVKLGIRQGPYYEVKEGLKEGELVVLVGKQRLRDGAAVTIEEETR